MERQSSQPSVSVVIPSYQCATYVCQAVDSVLSQRYPRELIETIVVDDGSTDGTKELLKSYGRQIRCIHQPNRGLPGARNAGIRAAGPSDYVAFLDADDYWLPDFLRVAVEAASLNVGALVTTDYFRSVGEERAVTPFYQDKQLGWVFDLPADEQLTVALKGWYGPIPSVTIVPRDVFALVGTFDETLRYAEDVDFFNRCLGAGRRIVLVPSAQGVKRFRRPGSQTERVTFAKARDELRVLARYRDRVSKRRWHDFVGLMHLVGCREALARRSYGSAAYHAFALLGQPAYLRPRIASKCKQLLRLS